MALRVWLPLDGTLENKGISDVTVTNNGATIDNNGKIGKCYSFDGTDDWIKVTMPSGMTSLKNCSIALWGMGNNSFGGISHDGGATLATCTMFDGRWQLANGSWTYINGGTRSTTAWHHFAITISEDTITTYYDGAQVTSTALASNIVTDITSSNFIEIGCDHPGGDEYGTIKVNDFRIYDHCLSAKEIKEISQGLVLHYKLDQLSQGSGQNLVVGLTSGGQTTVVNDTIVTSGQNSDTYFKIKLSSALELNKSYTMGIDAENLPDNSYFRFPIGSQSNSSAGYIDIYNGHNEVVFIANDVIVNCGTSLMMDDNTRTAWPNQCIFKNFYIYENTSITDSSGYGHNGNIIGELSVESGSSRYTSAIHIGSTSSKIHILNFPTAGFGNSYTFAWWAKVSSVNPMHWGFSDGIRLNGMYTGRLWNTGDGSNNPLYTPGTTTQVTAPTVNVWHHWAMTGDGTSCKVYQDGVYWGVAKTYKSISGTSIYINGWNSGTDYCSDNLSISDFRIYATALSAEDILDLYHTPTSIDNSKKLHTFELEETSENILSSSAFEQGGITDANGTETEMTTRLRTFYIPVTPNTSYKIFTNTNFQVRGVHFFTENQTWISFTSFFAQTGQFTTPSNCYYIRIPFQKADNAANITLADLGSMDPTLTAIIARTNGLSNKTYNINIFKNGITRANHFSISQKSSVDKSGIIEATDFIEK